MKLPLQMSLNKMEVTTEDFFTTIAPDVGEEEELVYEAPGAKLVGTIMIVISAVCLFLMLMCDLPKLYGDITGKSFRKRRRTKAKSKSDSGEGTSTMSSTPIVPFSGIKDDDDSDFEDKWDDKKRPGSGMKGKKEPKKPKDSKTANVDPDDALIEL